MHWSEAAALLLAVVFAILLVLVFGCFLYCTWVLVVAAWERRKPPVIAETAFGPFVKQDQYYWSGHVQADDRLLRVMAQDIGGKPNPSLLGRLPPLLEQLSLLEQTARQEEDRITERHVLSSISDSNEEEVEFTLGFSYDEENGGETVSVDFQGNQVIGSLVMED